jgi:GNAT superfamily N-acetyltransferase
MGERFGAKYFVKKVCRFLKRQCGDVLFIVRNIYASLFLKPIPEITLNERIIICGTTIKELQEALQIYSFFNNGNNINMPKYITCFFISKKAVFIVKDKTTNKIIGTELYYFNQKDIKENTIHQSFRVVLPQYQGFGIGTALTNYAISNFKNTMFSGISSRVSLNNIASLRSNMKLGFKLVEKYFDNAMQENRYYLICPFGKHDHWEYLN